MKKKTNQRKRNLQSFIQFAEIDAGMIVEVGRGWHIAQQLPRNVFVQANDIFAFQREIFAFDGLQHFRADDFLLVCDERKQKFN